MKPATIPSAPLGLGLPRLMYYCPGFSGVGHDRRALTLMTTLRSRWPGMSLLVVAHSRGSLKMEWPQDVELVKLPTLVRCGTTEAIEPFQSPNLAISYPALKAMREAMLLDIARHFEPDWLFIDNHPSGANGELLPTLRHLKATRPSVPVVLGIRDIAYGRTELRQQWTKEGAYEAIAEYIASVFVFGEREVFDLGAEAGMDRPTAAKVHYLGYLGRPVPPEPRNRLRQRLGLKTNRLVVVTVGGGGLGGEHVLETSFQALNGLGATMPLDAIIVGGPMLSDTSRARIRALVPPGGHIRFVDSVPDLMPYLAAADVVVARAGYNTVCEILCTGCRAILVPWVVLDDKRTPFWSEQILRARHLHKQGAVRMVEPDDLTPDRLREELIQALTSPAPSAPVSPILFNGAERFTREVGRLLSRAGVVNSPKLPVPAP